MSIAALGLNIAWEWTYAVRDLTHDRRLQAWVNLIWALADVVILAMHFRYERSELSRSAKTGLQPLRRPIVSVVSGP